MTARPWASVMFVLVLAAGAGAQDWNSDRALALVRRATDRRVQQLADSGLRDYQASARGYVTFLAQLGEGLRTPPRVVKADELALEVYWRAPNLSKQRIIGRRDTTLLPTDIEYHRDHLGIVQNNFPAIIRLGDGDEVRDVPHPLSVEGMRQYEFAIADSLRIAIPGRAIDVYELKVRPVDERQPRVVGAVYVERDAAQVVRMAFGFTRAAYLDKYLEDLFIVLENGLIGERFWLPRRQEIEIRRNASWLDYPVRGIIRGRWEIGEYRINTEAPVTRFAGPEIVVAPATELARYVWPPGRLVDSIPAESRLPTPTEVMRVQAEVRSLAWRQATRRSGAALAANSASDFLRFDRHSGLSVGAGVEARIGRGWTVAARGRHGLGDERTRGAVSVGWVGNRTGVRAYASDDTRDVGDVRERSLLVNSLAAQEFGDDWTNAYAVRAYGAIGTLDAGSARVTLDVAEETHAPLAVSAAPFRGSFRPAFDAASDRSVTVVFRLQGARGMGPLGAEWQPGVELRATSQVQRFNATLDARRPLGDLAGVMRAYVAQAHFVKSPRSQDLVFLGGPVSAPGFLVDELVADRAAVGHFELEVPVPFVGVNLGRFGRMPARATLAPHWTGVGLHRVSQLTTIARDGSGADPFRPRPTGRYHSAGVSLIGVFDLLRFDASRELPNGRWRFSVDVGRAFWDIL